MGLLENKPCTTTFNSHEVSTLAAKKRRQVTFAGRDEVHRYAGVRPEDHPLVWYTPEELSVIQAHTAWLAAELISQSVDPNSWPKAVLRVYRAFRANCSRSELLVILSSSNVYFDEHTIGLENAAIPVIGRDFLVRRRHMLAHVHRYQEMSLPDENMRAKLISDVSTSASHVSRSFAVLMAHLVADENENKEKDTAAAR